MINNYNYTSKRMTDEPEPSRQYSKTAKIFTKTKNKGEELKQQQQQGKTEKTM